MKKFLLTLAAVFGFASQAGSKTAITLDQIVAPTATGVMVNITGKGWSFAQIDSTLTIDTTTTPPTLRAPGGGQPTFVDWVTPTGTVNGTNPTFTLPSTPNPLTSVELVVNGLVYSQGGDFSISGPTITFTPTSIPSIGSSITTSYRR